MQETVEVKLARIEEGMVAVRGEMKGIRDDLKSYHHHVVGPVSKKLEAHETHITVLRRDRFWISSLAGVVFSWLGLKLFGKGG